MHVVGIQATKPSPYLCVISLIGQLRINWQMLKLAQILKLTLPLPFSKWVLRYKTGIPD